MYRLESKKPSAHYSVLGRCLLRRPCYTLAVLTILGTRHACLITGISDYFFKCWTARPCRRHKLDKLDKVDSCHLRLDFAEEDALEQYGFRRLCSHVRVAGLLRHKHSSNLTELGIYLVNLHLYGAPTDVENFVRFLKELILPGLAVGLQRWESHCLVVTRVHAAAFGVQEAASAVRRHVELTTPSETRLELTTLALENSTLHGKKERHTLAVRELHRRSCVVQAIFYLEGDRVRS